MMETKAVSVDLRCSKVRSDEEDEVERDLDEEG